MEIYEYWHPSNTPPKTNPHAWQNIDNLIFQLTFSLCTADPTKTKQYTVRTNLTKTKKSKLRT